MVPTLSRLQFASRLGCVILGSWVALFATTIFAEALSDTGQSLYRFSPPVSVAEGATQNDKDAIYFPESINVSLSEIVSVDLAAPGFISNSDDLGPPAKIQAGTWVDSYLIHFDPSSVPLGETERVFEGSIQFDREILGVILTDTLLDASQAEVSAPSTLYPSGSRQIELGSGDSIGLSPDQRSIIYRVAIGNGAVDQIRIVTRGTPTESHLAAFAQLHSETAATSSATLSAEFAINNGFLNGDPDRIVHLTKVLDAFPGGGLQLNGTFVLSPLESNGGPDSSRYDAAEGNWNISKDGPTSSRIESQHVLVYEPGPDSFVHTTTLTNIVGNHSYINHPDTNGNPDALILVTPNQVGNYSAFAHEHRVGVFWNGSEGRWAIYTEDQSPMPLFTRYHVSVLKDDGTSFVQTIDHPNGSVYIDHPLLNGNPNALPQTTHNWNRGGFSGNYLLGEVAMFYYTPVGRWALVVATSAFEGPIHFNIHIPPTRSHAIRDRGESASIGGHVNTIDEPRFVGALDAILLQTPSLASGAIPNPNPAGLFFSGDGNWKLFNENFQAWPILSANNILRVPSGRSSFVHVADERFNAFNLSYFDHHKTLEAPQALVFISRNWNPDGVSGPYDDENLGVYYNSNAAIQDWAVFHQDGSSMVEGAGFNVWVAPPEANAFRHQTDGGNLEGDHTTLDSPSLNGLREANPIVTQVWDPATAVYNNHTVGVDFNDSSQRWEIVNLDGASMPEGAFFNVVPVPEPGFSVALMMSAVAMLLVCQIRQKKLIRWTAPQR